MVDMSEEMEWLRKLCLDGKKEEIQNILDKKSNEDLLGLFEQIVNGNPYIYEPAIEIIIRKTYSEDNHFIELLCKLIEKTSLHIDSIREIFLEQQEKTIAISKKMINIGTRSGVCSGIIISPLLGENIIDKEIILDLESDDPVMQRYSLIAIYYSFISKNDKAIQLFIPKLLEVAGKIDQNNTNILILCLIESFPNEKDSVHPILEREIEQRGYDAASIYIDTTRYRDGFPIALLKKSLQIIETETPENRLIDDALGKIYEEDPYFVVEYLRARLNEDYRYQLVNDMLAYDIVRVGALPVIQMLEEEIDKGNPSVIHFGESILKDFFATKQEQLDWGKKWKNDERKERIILNLLGQILTELRNYEPSDIRDEAISIVKDFAEKKGLNYEKETCGINLGKDAHEGAEFKEITIKALFIIRQILRPLFKLDIEVLERNLKNFPNLCKVIDPDWLVENAKSESPHLLAFIYSEEPDYSRMEGLVRELESERDEKKKLGIALVYNSLRDTAISQLYWEYVFKTLNNFKLKIPKKKLHDVDNALSTLVEAEVLAKLVPYFRVELEPSIEGLGLKKIDAKIEINGEKALIEVVAVKERIETDVSHGVIMVSGGKVKSILLSKFRKLLKSGNTNLNIPVIIVMCLRNMMDDYDVRDAIYGQLQYQFRTSKDTQQIVETGPTRISNSFYEEKNSDIVTAIVAYKRDITKKDPLVGRLYLPPYQIVPKNPLSRGFRLKLQNALFGDSENSSWQSLLKIRGIDEDMARKLHANGIEDLGMFVMAKDEDLQIEDFDLLQLQELQKEGKRIISALSTDSIRFLKGIDQTTYDFLTKRGIYLITEFIKITEKPEGISSSIWNTLMEDAKRIMDDRNKRNYED